MKIIVMGASLVSGNRGVNALTRGTINSIISSNPDIDIAILSYSTNKELTHCIEGKMIKEIPFFAKKRLIDSLLIIFGLKKIVKNNQVIKNILSADYILDISEGDSFSDIYGIKRFILHIIGKYLAIKYKKRLIIMPQTIGPFNNKVVKRSARYILNNSYYIFTRDKISLNLVKDLKIDKNKIKCLPDMAFYMKAKINNNYNYYFEESNNVVGINISALLYNGGYNKKNMFNFKCDYENLMDKIIKKIMDNEKNKIILIPHVITEIEVENDLNTCKYIEKKYSKLYPNRIISVKENMSEDELKYIISKCDFFIGGRMHACIAAISSNVVTIPIAYSRKFVGIWQDIGLDECIADPRIHNEDKILSIYDYCQLNKDMMKEKLIKVNREYAKMIGEILNIIK